MDEEYYIALAKVRMERSRELLTEVKDLLDKEAYKSANSRAFYAIEKSVKALLTTGRSAMQVLIDTNVLIDWRKKTCVM